MSPFLLCSLAVVSLVAPTFAVAGEELDGGTFSVYFENDLFTGTDRYYTNGVKLGWSSTDLAKYGDTPYASPLLPLLERIPFINNPDFQKNLFFSLGQNIYTPDNTEAVERLDDDRPYAGWLYIGFGVVWKNADIRHSLGLNIGVIGPWSYSQESQRVIHDARGLGVPKGWDNQLHNELGAQLVYDATWRWPKHERRAGLNWEFLPHLGFSLGNVQTFANLGGELRFGVNLPDDFGTPGIDPSSATSTPVEGAERASRVRSFDIGAYLFARADGRAIAHTVFLDGNTFGESASADKKILVGDLSVGASLNYKDTKFAYAVVYRTQEFEAQEEAQLFGSISVNFAF